MSKILKGGKVIASGGFGCIFKPALKCKGKDERAKDGITKLMKKKYTARENESIMKYKKLLDKIPNYSKYFLIDGFTTCEPDTLVEEDLENFDKKCSALKKMDITSKNVNASLDKLTALNMPYGGVDVGDYIENVNVDFKKMVDLNNALINLLVNGIIPMNQAHVLHCDIKEANILVKEEENGAVATRLIDWGLSTTYTAEKKVPLPLFDRPFQYNVPFSNVIFNDKFSQMYSDFLKKTPNPSFLLIRSFVVNYVVFWMDDRGPGHIKTINDIFKEFFENSITNVEPTYKEELIQFDYTFYFIIEYIAQILFAFTKDNKFNSMEYFSTVFIKNIDVWGFIMVYLPILEKLYDHYDELSESEIKIIDKIKNIILFAIESSAKPIDIDKLVERLKELNPIFLQAQKQSTVSFLSKSSSYTSSHKKTSNKLTSNKKTSSKLTSGKLTTGKLTTGKLTSDKKTSRKLTSGKLTSNRRSSSSKKNTRKTTKTKSISNF